MKLTLLSLAGILMLLEASAQQSEWLDHYPSSGLNLGFRFCPGSNGDLFGASTFNDWVILAGDTIPALASDEDLLLVKWDSAGTVIWSRVIDNSSSSCAPGWGQEGPTSLHYNVTQDLLLVVQGSSCAYPTNTYTSRSHLVAYTGAGDHLWTRSMGAGHNNSAGAGLVSFTDDQEIGIYGVASAEVYFTGGPATPLSAGHFVVSYDVNGTYLQANSLPLSNGGFRLDQRTDSTYLFSLNATPSTLFYGQSLPVIAANEGVILRSDTAGSIIWSTFFRSSMECYMSRTTEAHGLIATIVAFSGDLLVPGTLPNTGISPRALAILSAQGDVLSLIPITSDENTTMLGLQIGDDGSVYLFIAFRSEIQIGNRQFIGQASRNGLIARFNSAGECLAGWTFGKIRPLRGSLMTHENAVYLSMGMDSTLTIANEVIPLDWSEYTRAIFVAKYAAIDGFTSIPPLKSATNNQLLIYANPNDGTCTIELPDALEWTADLILRIHDSQGRLIQSMPLRKEQGRIAMDIRAHAKGIYPVEVTDGQQRYTGTIVFQ